MDIDDQLISRLEKLARLKLDKNQRKALSDDLTRMLDMIEKLGGLDLSSVEPLIHPGTGNVFPRKDEESLNFSQEDALKNAPDADFPFFQVPKVIPK